MIALSPFLRSDRGASFLEYGLLAALIAIVVLVAVALFGNAVFNMFLDIDNSVSGL